MRQTTRKNESLRCLHGEDSEPAQDAQSIALGSSNFVQTLGQHAR